MADKEMQKVNSSQNLSQELKKKEEVKDTSKLLQSVGGFRFIRSVIPDADNLNPEKKAAKNIFLTEARFADKRENLKEEIKGWLALLDQEGLTRASDFADYCQSKVEQSDQQLREGITDALDATQQLERSYRSLDAFFKNADADKIKNLRIINVMKEDIADDQTHFRLDVDTVLKNGYDQLSLKDSYSILCVPGYVFQDKPTLLQWAKMAHKWKVMLVTDHAEEFSFDDLKENTEDYRDSDADLMNVIMTANWIEGRAAEKMSLNEEDEKAFYMYPSGALAGKLYNESANMAQGAAGKKYGTLDGVKGVRVDLLKSEIAALMDNQVVPMVYSEGRVMAFNNTTLYNGDNTDMKEYPIVRVFDWVRKVLMNFVHEVALENWDKYNSPKNLKAKIQDFLNRFKGYGKLFQDYEIKEPTFDKDLNKVTCDITLVPFNATKNFVIKVSADKKDKEDALEATNRK